MMTTTTMTSRSMAVKTTYVPPTREDSTAHRRMAMPDRRSSRMSRSRSRSLSIDRVSLMIERMRANRLTTRTTTWNL